MSHQKKKCLFQKMISKIFTTLTLLSLILNAAKGQLDTYDLRFKNYGDLVLRVQHEHGNNSMISYRILRSEYTKSKSRCRRDENIFF